MFRYLCLSVMWVLPSLSRRFKTYKYWTHVVNRVPTAHYCSSSWAPKHLICSAILPPQHWVHRASVDNNATHVFPSSPFSSTVWSSPKQEIPLLQYLLPLVLYHGRVSTPHFILNTGPLFCSKFTLWGPARRSCIPTFCSCSGWFPVFK